MNLIERNVDSADKVVMSILPRKLSIPIATALAHWFAKRAPRSDHSTLNLRNIYIFFSREGLLFALLLVITFIAGINYGNNLVLGLCFYLASVWLVSLHVTFAHISGLQIQLLEVTMAEVGAPVWVTLQLRSDSRQPRRQLLLGFEHNDYQDSAQKKTDNTVNQQVLLTYLQGEQIIRLPILTSQRGELVLPRLQIKTVYPLGIMRAWSYVYFSRTAWVYPKPEPFEGQMQYLALNSEDMPIGGQYTQYQQGQDDFERLDNYIAGESLARVSWAHVARGQGMLTKHFADPIGHEQILDYADMPAAHHEQKLAQLAYGVISLGQLGLPFAMRLPNEPSSAVVGQGDAFTQGCLLRLAKSP